MAVKLTEGELLAKLLDDPIFGLEFIVQNQPDKVRDRLKQEGYDTIGTPEADFETLKNLLDVNPAKLGAILNDIPYDNAAPNWTGELGTEFGTPLTGFSKSTSLWGGILTGVGGLFSAIGGAIGGGGTQTGTTLTADQIAALKEQEDARLKAEKAKRDTNIVIGVIGFILLLIIVAIIISSGKKKTQAKAA